MSWLSRLLALSALPLLVVAAAPASADDLKKTQKPCDPGGGFCRFISAGGNIPTIRKISFNAPSKGKANVTFHGSLTCETDGAGSKVVDLASQITTSNTATAEEAGPGGLSHQWQFSAAPQRSTTNLASSRLFAIAAAGKQTYYFRLSRKTMNTGTSCYVYNAAFTIDFDD